ncbi:MAG: class I SAM-dependent methyltransferase [Clostridium sp.]|nr:class I SAM-dependent methyltransferase [Clostridium sp.]
MSTSYTNFAYVYDTFMDNIPYKEWSEYLIHLFATYHITAGTLVELGCGTGTMSLLMNKPGFHIIGIDQSADMLTIAADKTYGSKNITLLQQDMRKFQLDMKAEGIYCVCDSLNYLLSPNDVCMTFQKVKEHLAPNGIFIFDLKTLYFYQTVLGDQTFCDHQKDCSYTWENSFFEEDFINQYDLTVFTRVNDTPLFERFCETHHQKAYVLSEIVDLLKQAGLEYITAYDAFTENVPHEESERIYIIARNGDHT